MIEIFCDTPMCKTKPKKYESVKKAIQGGWKRATTKLGTKMYFCSMDCQYMYPLAFALAAKPVPASPNAFNDEEMKTRVVHCKRESYDIKIGRPSKWGNPYRIGKDGTRDEVIEKYREYIQNDSNLMDALGELRGKTLGCWCKPKACHGDVLVGLIDEMPATAEERSG